MSALIDRIGQLFAQGGCVAAEWEGVEDRLLTGLMGILGRSVPERAFSAALDRALTAIALSDPQQDLQPDDDTLLSLLLSLLHELEDSEAETILPQLIAGLSPAHQEYLKSDSTCLCRLGFWEALGRCVVATEAAIPTRKSELQKEASRLVEDALGAPEISQWSRGLTRRQQRDAQSEGWQIPPEKPLGPTVHAAAMPDGGGFVELWAQCTRCQQQDTSILIHSLSTCPVCDAPMRLVDPPQDFEPELKAEIRRLVREEAFQVAAKTYPKVGTQLLNSLPLPDYEGVGAPHERTARLRANERLDRIEQELSERMEVRPLEGSFRLRSLMNKVRARVTTLRAHEEAAHRAEVASQASNAGRKTQTALNQALRDLDIIEQEARMMTNKSLAIPTSLARRIENARHHAKQLEFAEQDAAAAAEERLQMRRHRRLWLSLAGFACVFIVLVAAGLLIHVNQRATDQVNSTASTLKKLEEQTASERAAERQKMGEIVSAIERERAAYVRQQAEERTQLRITLNDEWKRKVRQLRVPMLQAQAQLLAEKRNRDERLADLEKRLVESDDEIANLREYLEGEREARRAVPVPASSLSVALCRSEAMLSEGVSRGCLKAVEEEDSASEPTSDPNPDPPHDDAQPKLPSASPPADNSLELAPPTEPASPSSTLRLAPEEQPAQPNEPPSSKGTLEAPTALP